MSKCLYPKTNCSEILVDNFRDLVLQKERLGCRLAGICAVTVLAGLTERTDGTRI